MQRLNITVEWEFQNRSGEIKPDRAGSNGEARNAVSLIVKTLKTQKEDKKKKKKKAKNKIKQRQTKQVQNLQYRIAE